MPKVTELLSDDLELEPRCDCSGSSLPFRLTSIFRLCWLGPDLGLLGAGESLSPSTLSLEESENRAGWACDLPSVSFKASPSQPGRG